MSGYTLGVSESVGKKVGRLRAEKGWTLEQLSDASGVSGGTINRIELEKRKPHPSTLKSILEALGEGSNERPRSVKETGRATRRGEAGGGAGIEDRLGDLLSYIGTLEGKRKSEFIRAVVALLTALEHARPAAGSGGASDDGR